jgi:hypothetical protein
VLFEKCGNKNKKKYINEFYMLFFEIMMFLFGDKKTTRNIEIIF